jgi:hypothetical protein
MRLSTLSYLLRHVVTMPHVNIRVGDEPTSQAFYTYATKRHPRYFIVQNKSWGAALLKLPDRFPTYLQGSSRKLLRQKRRAALSAGYYFDEICPLDHVEEILAINLSCPLRQGRLISPFLLDKTELQKYFAVASPVFAVRDGTGVVKAYAHTPIYGELGVFNRLLGHYDHLEIGIMYLLVSEVIRTMCERRVGQGSPQWVMYDMMFGGGDGLRYFKERLGFQPHRVSWCRLPSRPADCVSQSGRTLNLGSGAAGEAPGEGSLP